MAPSYPSVPPVLAGLCDTCQHRRLVPTSRGRQFVQCRRAAVDPTLPRYPVLPVEQCRGFEPEVAPAGAPRRAAGPIRP